MLSCLLSVRAPWGALSVVSCILIKSWFRSHARKINIGSLGLLVAHIGSIVAIRSALFAAAVTAGSWLLRWPRRRRGNEIAVLALPPPSAVVAAAPS